MQATPQFFRIALALSWFMPSGHSIIQAQEAKVPSQVKGTGQRPCTKTISGEVISFFWA